MHQLRHECARPLDRYSRLSWLAATNVTLFYHVLLSNLEELAPVVYTPTVGEACQTFSAHYRCPEGLFVSAVGNGGRSGARAVAAVRNWPNHNVQARVRGCRGGGGGGGGGSGGCMGGHLGGQGRSNPRPSNPATGFRV